MTAANNKHEALYQEILAVIRKYDLPSVEILAVCANMTGKVLAMQDQTTGTTDFYMKIVAYNLELGNQQMIAGVFGDTKGRA